MRIERTDGGLWTRIPLWRGALHIDLTWHEGNWSLSITWIGSTT